MLNELIKKLRKAADALEELQDSNPSSNIRAARSIELKMDKNTLPYKEYIAKWTKANPKQEEGRFKRKKKHWTQTPKGKKKLALAMKKVWADKRDK